jgi:hypothetical protein
LAVIVLLDAGNLYHSLKNDLKVVNKTPQCKSISGERRKDISCSGSKDLIDSGKSSCV